MSLKMGWWLNVKAGFSKSNSTKETKTGFMCITEGLA